jgi:hypothetical protein
VFGVMLCASGVLGAAVANRLAVIHDF